MSNRTSAGDGHRLFPDGIFHYYIGVSTLISEIRFPNGATVRLIQGDITKVSVDAIVNAANSALAGGGGVDGAIHRAGGPTIMRELDELRPKIGGCPTGSAVATGAGKLPAKHVFHAVGPVYRGGRQGEAELLRSCYSTCLELARERAARTISFPAISAGIYGYPLEEAAEIAVFTVGHALQAGHPTVNEAVFVLFGSEVYDAFSRALSKLQ
jgi:O-acetyl-ADP-ribose deacetylase (regulator of RNase III)